MQRLTTTSTQANFVGSCTGRRTFKLRVLAERGGLCSCKFADSRVGSARAHPELRDARPHSANVRSLRLSWRFSLTLDGVPDILRLRAMLPSISHMRFEGFSSQTSQTESLMRKIANENCEFHIYELENVLVLTFLLRCRLVSRRLGRAAMTLTLLHHCAG